MQHFLFGLPLSLFCFSSSAPSLEHLCAGSVCPSTEIRLGMHTHNKSGGALLCSKSSMKVGEKEKKWKSIDRNSSSSSCPTDSLSSICSALYSAYCHRLSVRQSGSPFVKGLQSITTRSDLPVTSSVANLLLYVVPALSELFVHYCCCCPCHLTGWLCVWPFTERGVAWESSVPLLIND